MRIAIDARMISSSTGRYVERLLHHLQEIDDENTYLVLMRAADIGFWRPDRPSFQVVEADFDYYSLAEQSYFLRFLSRLNADLVHFTLPQQPVLYRRPHVTTFHDLTLLRARHSEKNAVIHRVKQLLGSVVFRVAARSSRIVITPSRYTRQAVLQFARIEPASVVVTYEAADPPAAAREALPIGEGFLLYVGQQVDYKNLRRLILAHQRLRRTDPDLQLVLAGGRSNASRTLEAWVHQQGFHGVVFPGFVSEQQLAWLYASCACYVFPSLMEGFGLPGLEAMRAGAPVVASAATSLPEVYADAALYFDPEDVGSMATTIQRVLSDPLLRADLVERGRHRAAEFSWRRMAEETLAVYRSAA